MSREKCQVTKAASGRETAFRAAMIRMVLFQPRRNWWHMGSRHRAWAGTTIINESRAGITGYCLHPPCFHGVSLRKYSLSRAARSCGGSGR